MNIQQELEQSIKANKEKVALGDAIERLKNNTDFKKVFMDEYFQQEAIRLVHLRKDPNLQSAEQQASILGQMDAIGHLMEFLNHRLQWADIARKQLEDTEAELEAYLAGDE